MSRNAWVFAFADLSAVLCAFFVLILAMSDFDAPSLDRMETIFGKAEGTWVRPEAQALSGEAIRRNDDAELRDSKYFTAVLRDRFARADWPWVVAENPGRLTLQQTLQPGGPIVPDAMVLYLQSLGYRFRTIVVMPRDSNRGDVSIGVFDDGLRVATDLADSLRSGGGIDQVPASVRFGADRSPPFVEIVFDQGLETE